LIENVEENIVEEIFDRTCEYCNKVFPSNEFQEHLDFHYAMEMQDIENKRRQFHQSSVSAKKHKKRKQKTNDVSVLDYFKK